MRAKSRARLMPRRLRVPSSCRSCAASSTVTRVASPFAASSRGFTVSARSSSAVSNNVLAGGNPRQSEGASGHALPMLKCAATSRAINDLPNPGSPTSRDSFPRGMRSGQSHSRRSDSTPSSFRMITGPSSPTSGARLSISAVRSRRRSRVCSSVRLDSAISCCFFLT